MGSVWVPKRRCWRRKTTEMVVSTKLDVARRKLLTAIPVSYTHLDVYKRQLDAFGDTEAVSHLSVVGKAHDGALGAS